MLRGYQVIVLHSSPGLYFRSNSIVFIAIVGATAEYPATIVPDSTCAHIFKERDMCRNKLTQVAGYSAVKLKVF